MSVHELYGAATLPSDVTVDFRAMSDVSLVTELKRGSRPALAEVSRRYDRMLRESAARVVGPMRAEDVVQDVLLKLMLGATGIQDGTRLVAWLNTTARRTAIDHLRAAATRREQLVPVPPDLAQPEDMASRVADVESSTILLESVRPDDALLLSAAYLEERSLREIADSRGTTPGSVKVMLHRARRRARAAGARVGVRGSVIPGFGWLRDRLPALAPSIEALGIGISAAVIGLLIGVGVTGSSTPQIPSIPSGTIAQPQAIEAGVTSADGTSSPTAAGSVATPGIAPPTDQTTTAGQGGPSRSERFDPTPDAFIPVPGTDGEIQIFSDREAAGIPEPAYRIEVGPEGGPAVSNDRRNSTTPIAPQFEESFGQGCRAAEENAGAAFTCVEDGER